MDFLKMNQMNNKAALSPIANNMFLLKPDLNIVAKEIIRPVI